MQAPSQTLLDPNRISPGLKKLLENREEKQSLKCEVRPIQPALNFGFSFQSGFVARVPLSQYLGSGHGWAILMKVTPQGGDRLPAYLATRIGLPDIPETKLH